MIPVEYLWLTVILVFAIVGMGRSIRKELGVSAVMLLSLFVLNLGQQLILDKIAAQLPETLTRAPSGTITAIYYIVGVLFVAFISYQGIVLIFPIKELKGVPKWFFGFLGGLFNGYLIIGTIWDVVAQANYFGIKVSYGSTGTFISISETLTKLHQSIIKFLPVALMNSGEFVPYVFLVLGMILLLAIILK